MSPTIRTVASYNTHQEHSIDFFGNDLTVTVTPTASVIRRWINDVQTYNRYPYTSQPLLVGVGVQWTPTITQYADPSPESYNGNATRNSYYSDPPPHRYYADTQTLNYCADPTPDTLQLCVGKKCLIIQLSHCDLLPGEIHSFLADQTTTFVGVWNGQDARKLAESRHQLEINNLLDIRNYIQDSQGRSLRSCSFEEIVEVIMGYQGVRLDPEISLSDWSVYNLSYEQILQASIDVYVCYELGAWLRLWEV